ncbi:MAG: carbohydrate kinase [Bacteroidetes bacterium]|nr:carbohydrate kinase [Fibrella sp.]
MIGKIVRTCSLAFVMAAATFHIARAGTAYDGSWSLSIVTQRGGCDPFCVETASPDLGMLNSGLQLYWLKHTQPTRFGQIVHSLHLPQFCSYLFTQTPVADLTSVGCHTGLWHFARHRYHDWLAQEQILTLKQPVVSSATTIPARLGGRSVPVGVGIHDSSAALIPYLKAFREPFLLISTGTWCIALNPFNTEPLTINELEQDCLTYLTYEGKPVKASRIFAGNEHERMTRHLADYFHVAPDHYKTIPYDPALVAQLRTRFRQSNPDAVDLTQLKESAFVERNLNEFTNYTEAYHQFMLDLTVQQTASVRLVLGRAGVSQIFVDGGFSRNPLYMHLLAERFPGHQLYASDIAQATALGAAIVIEAAWNTRPFDGQQFVLKQY